jgi:hypothetical protein
MRNTTRWVVAGVLVLAFSLTPGFAADEETAVNPYYKYWADFKKGSTVTHVERTTFGDDATDELPGGVDEKIVRYKLVRSSDKGVSVEAVVIQKEFLNTTRSAPSRIYYPAKVNKANLKAMLLAAGAKTGEDTVKLKVNGKEREFKCKTIEGSRKKKGQVVKQKFWLSTSVPGGIVQRKRTTLNGDKLVAETTTTVRLFKVVK